MVIDEVAEIGIATESLTEYTELVTLPCYEWQHMLVLPMDAPALASKDRHHAGRPGAEPLITYHPSFHRPYPDRPRLCRQTRKLQPRIALEAIDSDVIKTYVRLGLGVGIVAEMAVTRRFGTAARVACWRAIPPGRLFGVNVARVAFKRSAYLRNFVYHLCGAAERQAGPQPDCEKPCRPCRVTTITNNERFTCSPASVIPHFFRNAPYTDFTPACRRHDHFHRDVGPRVLEKKAVNLGQGFPDFACDPAAGQCRVHASDDRRATTSTRPCRVWRCCARRSGRQDSGKLYGRRYSAADEITITAGATQAIITAVLAVVHPGDEVIVLEPCYDSYVPNIELAGGTVVRVPLTPGTFRPDFDKISGAPSRPRTRAIIVNSPHNPSATVWTAKQTCCRLQECAGTDRRAADQRRGIRAHGV